MKFIKWVSFSIILASIVLFTPLDLSAQLFFHDGNNLVRFMREYDKHERGDPSTNNFECGLYAGYVTGAYDAMRSDFNAPEATTINQICSIVGKYLKENPGKWTAPASILIRDALRKAFPKK